MFLIAITRLIADLSAQYFYFSSRNISQKDRVMYDCLGITLFFNEYELLFLQLKTLSRVCEHIIVVEPECNTRGEARENLEFDCFLEKFGDAIGGISYEYLKIPGNKFKKVKDLNKHWAGGENEGMCRSIPIINNKAKYYIFNDVDEIFSDEQIEEIRSLISDGYKGKMEFRYQHHNYYLNWQCFYFRNWKHILLNRDWNQVFCKNKPVIDQCVHLFDYEAGQEFALKLEGKRQAGTYTNLKTTGYHFSFLYSLKTKLSNYSHTELSDQVSIAMKRREKKLAAVHPNMRCRTVPISDIHIRDLHEHIDIFRPFISE